MLYDNLALSLAILPCLIFYFTIITAPMTLFIVIRYWRAQRSLVHRSSFRFILAGLLALLEIGGWVTIIYFLVTQHSR